MGAKANKSVNKSTSTGVTVTNTNSRAFQHLYTDNSGNDKTNIYHRLITTFYKSIGSPHILHINVEIQALVLKKFEFDKGSSLFQPIS